jgi:DnaJ like chaperone protein
MPLDCISSYIEPARNRSLRARLADVFIGWWPSLARLVRPRPVHQTAAFSAAVVALAAKMAKADGVVVCAECETFERFFEPAPEELPRIRNLYRLASQDTAGFEIYAQNIARMLKDEPELKINVLECLLMIACADGVLHPAEEAFLRTVGHAFGITCDEFKRIRARFVRDIDDPFDVLGLEPNATPREIRSRYIELVQRFHPDRLIARGAQAALVKAATVKLAAINAAYEAITTGRRFEGGRA